MYMFARKQDPKNEAVFPQNMISGFGGTSDCCTVDNDLKKNCNLGIYSYLNVYGAPTPNHLIWDW